MTKQQSSDYGSLRKPRHAPACGADIGHNEWTYFLEHDDCEMWGCPNGCFKIYRAGTITYNDRFFSPQRTLEAFA